MVVAQDLALVQVELVIQAMVVVWAQALWEISLETSLVAEVEVVVVCVSLE